MSKTIISIEQVNEVKPHPNADRLDIIQVLGYQVVTGRGSFKVGDMVTYFPPDILLPPLRARALGVINYLKFAIFPGDVKKTQCRVGAARLRGIPSHGFCASTTTCDSEVVAGVEIGTDVTDLFGAQKYIAPVRIGAGDAAAELPAFHAYTNIENIQRYPNAFWSGDRVIITEKIHGCLTSQQRVTMADGSKKKISKVEVDDQILGSKHGQICTATVTKTFKNGHAHKWLNIKTTRINVDRGSSFSSITCTPEHKFWSPTLNDYVIADNLSVGDSVLMFRSNLELSPVAYQVLLGKMLGDGSLTIAKEGASIGWGHVIKSLTEWTGQGVGCLYKPQKPQTSGYGSRVYRANTIRCNSIKKAFEDFYNPGRKKLPEWVIDKITPIALAFWYMDDGSLAHADNQEDRAVFNSCGFTEVEHDTLLKCLEKFNIKGTKYEHEGFWRIRVNSDEAEKLFLLIAPYIQKDLQYKLPERYRGSIGWLPGVNSEYKPRLVKQVITSIDDVTQKVQSLRYDLETTTHNYFASDILVHNSNCRLGLVRDTNGEFKFCAGSHHVNRKEGGLYWEFMTANTMNLLSELADEQHSVVVFGEIFGPGIQDMDYGRESHDFRVFDISVDGQYLYYWDMVSACDNANVSCVPLLYDGLFSLEVVEEHTYGKSTFGQVKCKFKDREGCVIRPLSETYSEVLGGRLIVKSVSADYRDRKGAKDAGE